MRNSTQAGSGKLGFIVTLAVVSCALFALIKIVPVRVDAYQFRDTLRTQARMGAVRNTDAEVAKRIMTEAENLEIPLVRKNLSIKRTKSKMIVTARYELPIDLKVTTYVFKFDESEEAPLF